MGTTDVEPTANETGIDAGIDPAQRGALRSAELRWDEQLGGGSEVASAAVDAAAHPVVDEDPPSDAGMSTVEYAVGTVVAAAFAAVLYRIVTGDSVVAGLTRLVNSALNTAF